MNLVLEEVRKSCAETGWLASAQPWVGGVLGMAEDRQGSRVAQAGEGGKEWKEVRREGIGKPERARSCWPG